MRGRSLKRRGFITVLGGAAAWPLAGRAQQLGGNRRLGVLLPYPANDPATQAILTAFAHALAGFGWVEGKNIRIDYRFAAGDPTLYKAYAAELVGLSPDAIFANASPAVAALRLQTRTIDRVKSATYLQSCPRVSRPERRCAQSLLQGVFSYR